MKKIILLVGLLIILGYVNYIKKDQILIPSEAIRFRIIASSNNIQDIAMKEKVKEAINDFFDVSNVNSIEEARKNILNNKNTLKEKIEYILEKNNYNKSVNIAYGLNYFPKKEYKGISYKEGNYESLVVKIGEAKGNNFWCVLYPPLCMIDENKIKNEKNYKFFIKEIIKKYI